MKAHPFVSEIESVSRLYVAEKLTAEEISEETGLSPTTIYRRLRAGGVNTRSRGPMAPGRNFEPIIWSANMAYAVGLIAADGCLSTDQRHIHFSSKDREQIENFFIAIDSEHKITTKKSGYSSRKYLNVQFSDARLYRFFNSIGLTPKKSLTIGPLQIPDKFFTDFIRGHLDGDGSIQAVHKGQYKRTPMFRTVFYSYSPDFLVWLRDKIGDLIGIKGQLRSPRLTYARAASQCLWRAIYADPSSIRLSRKWEIANRYIDIHVEEKSTRHDYLSM